MQTSQVVYGPMTMWDTYDANLQQVGKELRSKRAANPTQQADKYIRQQSLPVLKKWAIEYKKAAQALQMGNLELSAFLRVNEHFKRALAAACDNKQIIENMRAITDVLAGIK